MILRSLDSLRLSIGHTSLDTRVLDSLAEAAKPIPRLLGYALGPSSLLDMGERLRANKTEDQAVNAKRALSAKIHGIVLLYLPTYPNA